MATRRALIHAHHIAKTLQDHTRRPLAPGMRTNTTERHRDEERQLRRRGLSLEKPRVQL